MTNIRDIQSDADMVAFLNSELALILMTPEWSIYPRKSLRTLETIMPDLTSKGFQVFTVTKDDPAENQPLFNWLSKHNQGRLCHVGSGAGELIICRYGVPIHVENSTSSKTAVELKTIIFNAIESEGEH